jgi:hypothetical protein
MDLVAVPAAITAAEVERLVHVAGKVDEELERLEGGVGRGRAGDEICQDRAHVLDRVEDVGAVAARPAIRAGELAVVRRVVAHAFGVVQRGGPVRAEADFVGPGGDGREVARRVAVRELPARPSVATVATVASTATTTTTTFGIEDGADAGQDLWVEVRLCEGSDDFVAF